MSLSADPRYVWSLRRLVGACLRARRKSGRRQLGTPSCQPADRRHVPTRLGGCTLSSRVCHYYLLLKAYCATGASARCLPTRACCLTFFLSRVAFCTASRNRFIAPRAGQAGQRRTALDKCQGQSWSRVPFPASPSRCRAGASAARTRSALAPRVRPARSASRSPSPVRPVPSASVSPTRPIRASRSRAARPRAPPSAGRSAASSASLPSSPPSTSSGGVRADSRRAGSATRNTSRNGTAHARQRSAIRAAAQPQLQVPSATTERRIAQPSGLRSTSTWAHLPTARASVAGTRARLIPPEMAARLCRAGPPRYVPSWCGQTPPCRTDMHSLTIYRTTTRSEIRTAPASGPSTMRARFTSPSSRSGPRGRT